MSLTKKSKTTITNIERANTENADHNQSEA